MIAADQVLWKPPFDVDDQQALARVDHDESGTPVADVRLVINDAIGGKMMTQKFMDALLSVARVVWQPVRNTNRHRVAEA